MRAARLLVVLLVVGVGVPATAPAAADTGTALASTAASSHSIDRTLTLRLTPDRPGEIRVHGRVDVPDGVTELTAFVPERATVVSTDGFTRQSETEYEWDRTTDSPTLTWRLPVNRTATTRRGATAGARSSGYVFVDAGSWALVETPELPISYAGFGSKPSVTKAVVADGSGVAGDAMTYLGPYEERERRAAGQRIRLVVPEAAETSERPETVLDSIGAGAEALEIGQRDDEVVGFVAPTTVEWGAPGLQRGERDFWVRDDQRLDRAGNIWLHEYVHTRQAARTTNSSRWVVEGGAEYYAALLTLQQGRIDFETFSDHLAVGTRDAYADAVLADRDSWTGTGANYWKGALVAGAIDRRIRLATDRERTLADAYRRLNDRQNVSNREFLDAVGETAGSDARRFARRHTTTDATPPLWNESQHRVAFASAANVSARIVRVEARGPSRNATVEPPVTLVPGERVRLRVQVENVGPVPGDYEVALRRDGERVDAASGSLDPGEATTVTLETGRVEATGEHTLAVGEETVAVAVRDPAVPTVDRVDAPETVAPGEGFTITASVRNDADRPADAALPVTVDGERVGAVAVQLAPGASATVSATVRVMGSGEHAVGVGDATATVRVPDDATPVGTLTTRPRTGTATATETGATGPGFGALAALVALAALTAARRGRERR